MQYDVGMILSQILQRLGYISLNLGLPMKIKLENVLNCKYSFANDVHPHFYLAFTTEIGKKLRKSRNIIFKS